jgi:hypothetical protein
VSQQLLHRWYCQRREGNRCIHIHSIQQHILPHILIVHVNIVLPLLIIIIIIVIIIVFVFCVVFICFVCYCFYEMQCYETEHKKKTMNLPCVTTVLIQQRSKKRRKGENLSAIPLAPYCLRFALNLACVKSRTVLSLRYL